MRTIVDPKAFTDMVFERFPQIYQREDERLGLAMGSRIVRIGTEDGHVWKYYRPEDYEDVEEEERDKLHLEVRGPLYRYLLSIFMTAGAEAFKRAEQLWYAQDTARSPDRLFRDWYENFGLPFYHDIPIWSQRKILSILGELYIRKGTRGAIEYLAQQVTGFETEIIELRYRHFRTWTPHNPFSTQHKPSVINPQQVGVPTHRLVPFGSRGIQDDREIESDDENTRHLRYDVMGVRRILRAGRTREVLLVLRAPMEDEAVMRVRENVFKRFLQYFFPFDVRWSILTRRFYEDSHDVTNNTVAHWWDNWETRAEADIAFTNYTYWANIKDNYESFHAHRAREAAITNGIRTVDNRGRVTHSLLGRFRLNQNWRLGKGLQVTEHWDSIHFENVYYEVDNNPAFVIEDNKAQIFFGALSAFNLTNFNKGELFMPNYATGLKLHGYDGVMNDAYNILSEVGDYKQITDAHSLSTHIEELYSVSEFFGVLPDLGQTVGDIHKLGDK